METCITNEAFHREPANIVLHARAITPRFRFRLTHFVPSARGGETMGERGNALCYIPVIRYDNVTCITGRRARANDN